MNTQEPRSNLREKVICRPARQQDTQDVMELTRTIWEGHDYVPQAWYAWLKDENGILAVAELEGKVVGLFKLSVIAPGQWWLQGLRVHPDYEGHGIASRLHDYAMEYWEQNAGGVVRLSTYRPQVRHLCERTGFKSLGEFSLFGCDVTNAVETHLEALDFDQAKKWLAEQGVFEKLPFYSRFVEFGWEWVAFTPELVLDAARKNQLFFNEPDILMTVREDEEDGERMLMMQWLSCSLSRLENALLAFCRLGAKLGHTQVGWIAPLAPDLQNALDNAHYKRYWDGFVWLFEKRQAG